MHHLINYLISMSCAISYQQSTGLSDVRFGPHLICHGRRFETCPGHVHRYLSIIIISMHKIYTVQNFKFNMQSGKEA